jgi:hypothetical protein
MVPMMHALEGHWEGRGHGSYPTIEDFDYLETIVLERLADKPILAYEQRTRSPEGKPLHAESGFYRFDDEGGVELVIAQPTGIAETHRGSITKTGLELTMTGLVTTPSAVEVRQVRRLLSVEGDRLTYRLDMAAVGQDLTLHLVAELGRV